MSPLGWMTRAFVLIGVVIVSFALAFAIGLTSEAGAAAPAAAADLPAPELEQRRAEPQTTVDTVSATVMCPTCDTTLDQSDSPSAQRMRTYVTAAVAAGWTEGEIREGLVAEYGGDESVLATPRAQGIGLLAWLVPAGVALLALLGGALVLRRWRTPRLTGDDGPTEGQARSTSSS